MGALDWSGIAGGVASLGGTILSQLTADARAETAFKHQKELMRLQNQYAVENWNRENNYNTPAEQRKRLAAAGLNPDLVYGSGASGLQAGSIDSPSAPSAPMAPSMDFSKPVNDAVQAAVGIAQAKKAKSEAIKTDIENKYFEDQILSSIENTKALTSLSNEQKARVTLECQNVSAQWNLMQKQIEAIEKDNKLKDKYINSFDRRFNAEIGYLESSNELTKLQKDILSENKENILKLAKGQADLVSTIATLTDRYGDAQAVVGMVSSVVGAITDVLGSLGPKKVMNIINKIPGKD